MLFGKLLPREGNFFLLFDRHAEEVHQAALAFSQLVENYDNTEQRELFTAKVSEIEHAADRTTSEILRLLHKTFITPLDRDQIHLLAHKLDDIADTFQHTSAAMMLYDVHGMTPEIKNMTKLAVEAAGIVKNAVQQLGKLGKSDAVKIIMDACQKIDQLESESDKAQGAAISALFRKEPDVRELIKLTAIYEQLEQITDRCEDVADIIEGIVLENS